MGPTVVCGTELKFEVAFDGTPWGGFPLAEGPDGICWSTLNLN